MITLVIVMVLCFCLGVMVTARRWTVLKVANTVALCFLVFIVVQLASTPHRRLAATIEGFPHPLYFYEESGYKTHSLTGRTVLVLSEEGREKAELEMWRPPLFCYLFTFCWKPVFLLRLSPEQAEKRAEVVYTSTLLERPREVQKKYGIAP